MTTTGPREDSNRADQALPPLSDDTLGRAVPHPVSPAELVDHSPTTVESGAGAEPGIGTTAGGAPASPSRRRRRGQRTGLRGLSWTGRLGIVGLLALALMSFVGPLLVAKPRITGASTLQPPSAEHLLGTDYGGRDNLELLVHGGADMLLLAAVAGVLTCGIAATVGMLGAFLGGAIDAALVRVTDLWLTIPRFILLVVVASLVQLRSVLGLAVLIAVFSWPALARQIRAQALSLRQRDYVEAAVMLQMPTGYVLRRHFLPNMAPYVVVMTIQAMTQAIYQQVGLAFLGLIPLTDNWGTLFSVAYGQNALYLPAAAWSMFAPVAAICLLQLCLVFTSRALEEHFDPRLRSR